jgi:hypothetical protein
MSTSYQEESESSSIDDLLLENLTFDSSMKKKKTKSIYSSPLPFP